MITSHPDIDRMAQHALGLGADAGEIEHFKQIATAYLGPTPDIEMTSPEGQLHYLLSAALVKYYDAIVKAKDAKIAQLEKAATTNEQAQRIALLESRIIQARAILQP